jgi:hypothetical protein
MNLLIIGEIQPQKTTSSSVILYRHFSNNRIHLSFLGDQEMIRLRPFWFNIAIRLVNKLSKITSQYLVQSFEPVIVFRKWARLFSSTRSFDLILCVAHGRFALHAWRLGLMMNKPVVTFFHDWWPEMMGAYRGQKDLVVRAVERDFENLQMQSALSLAVCPGMANHLVFSKRIEVLYPIPDPAIKCRRSFPSIQTLRVVYTGSLWNPYGQMLLNLERKISDEPCISLKIHGDPEYIPLPERVDLMKRQVLENFIDDEFYKKLLVDGADVLLAVMGGDSMGKIRMATSFPSKVANYFQTGNVVLLWALPGSSLRTFALEYDYPWLVESENASDVVLILKRLTEDHSLLHQARLDAKRIKEEVFDPLKIQRQFEAALQRAVHFHSTL